MIIGQNIAGKKVVVIGLGRSGQATALLAKKKQAAVYVSEIEESRAMRVKAATLRKKGINVELGRHRPAFFQKADLFITSPGVKNDALPLIWAKKNKVDIISEVEFASWFCRVPIIAVTGTNGKTTVTTLIGKILKNAGQRVSVCGNIGNPFSGEVLRRRRVQVVVLEVSSFQLEFIKSFRPTISIILNISRNHLDHHHSLKRYREAKSKILKNQKNSDFAILNFDDRRVRNLGDKTKAKILFFAKKKNAFSKYRNRFYGACWLENNCLRFKSRKTNQDFLCQEHLKLKGRHNLENIMAAILAAKAQKISKEKIIPTLLTFKGLEHRCEYVSDINGIKFTNDSKSTTVDATAKALAMFADKSVILICGGRDKGSDFSLIRKSIRRKVKFLVVIGEAKQKIKAALAGSVRTVSARSLKAAVQIAYHRAKAADTVLLSPMCSSFDMFENFEERGREFKRIVGCISSGN